MDNLDLLVGLASTLLGGLCGWFLRAKRAQGERMRLAHHLEGRTRMAEKDLQLARREVTEARLLMRRIQEEHGDEAPRVAALNHEVEVLSRELTAVRRELLDREQVLERFNADDLSRLPGVGPVLEGRLKEVGIKCFEDLCRMDEPGIAALADKLNIPLRTIKRHDWPNSAAKLVAERGVGIS